MEMEFLHLFGFRIHFHIVFIKEGKVAIWTTDAANSTWPVCNLSEHENTLEDKGNKQ